MAEYLSLGPVDPNTAMWMRDAARQEKLPRIKRSRRPRSTSPTAGARRSGRTSADAGATTWSATPAAPAARSGDADRRHRTSARHEDEGAVRGVARGAAQTAEHGAEDSTPAATRRALIDEGQRDLGGESERRPRAQPRRTTDRVPLRARPVLDRPVSSPTPRPGKVLAARSRTRRSTRTSAACSSSTRRARGRRTAGASRSRWSRRPAGARDLRRAIGDRDREDLRFPDLDEIFNPTWSPDGRPIAFSATDRRPHRPVRLRHRRREPRGG